MTVILSYHLTFCVEVSNDDDLKYMIAEAIDKARRIPGLPVSATIQETGECCDLDNDGEDWWITECRHWNL